MRITAWDVPRGLVADKVVDGRGCCLGPLLAAKRGIADVKAGEVLEIWSPDPTTKAGVEVWAGKVGHEFLGSLAADGYERIFVRRLR
jgi:TusA-related sulfurtransferase